MLRIMLADLYRALQGKLFWLTALILAIIAALSVFVFGMAPGVVHVEHEVGYAVVEDGYIIAEPVPLDLGNFELTAAEAVTISAGGMGNLAYVVLAIAAVIALTPFDAGAIKNELSVGASRSKLYFSKWLLSAFITLIFMLLYTFLFFVFGLIGGGLGEWSSEFVTNFAWGFAAQILFVLGYLSVAMLFIFGIRKEGVSIYGFIGFVLIPAMTGALLSLAWPDIIDIFAIFELGLLIQTFAEHNEMYTYQIVRGIAVGTAYIVLPTALGLALFRKADIK